MAINPHKRRLINFAAIKFVIQYYEHEHSLVNRFRSQLLVAAKTHTDEGWKVVAEWATHFAIARNLRGIAGADGKHRQFGYGKIFALLRDERTERLPGESISDWVMRVEKSLKRELDINNSLLSATSKFLWLKSQDTIIFDSKLVKALRPERNTYESYVNKWQVCYEETLPLIEQSVFSLRDVAHAFPLDWDIEVDTKNDWFLKRVFDTYYWSGLSAEAW